MESSVFTAEQRRAAAERLRGNRLESLVVFTYRRHEGPEEEAALLQVCEALRSNTSLVELRVKILSVSQQCMFALREVLRSNTSLRVLALAPEAPMDVIPLVEGLRGNSSLRRLFLGYLAPGGLAALCKALWTRAPLVLLHRLFGTRIGTGPTIVVGDALRSRSALEELVLKGEDFGCDDMIPVAEMLRHNACLQKLTVHPRPFAHGAPLVERKSSGVCCAGAEALGRALKCNASLRELDLRFNSIGPKGAEALGQALLLNASLQTFKLWQCDIGPEGAVALGQALLLLNASLQTLKLRQCHIGCEGAVALGQALRVNTTLQVLVLEANGIGPSGAVALAQGLQANSTLQRLNLACNPTGREGATALAAALQLNRSLRELHLSEQFCQFTPWEKFALQLLAGGSLRLRLLDD